MYDSFDIGKISKILKVAGEVLNEQIEGERENPRTATKDNEEAMGLLSLLRKLKRTEGEVRPHTE